MFANILNSIDYDIVCITDSWLTSDFPNNALFHTKDQVYQSDRLLTMDNKTKHGGVFIAIKMKCTLSPSK